MKAVGTTLDQAIYGESMAMSERPTELAVGIDSWIIKDGTHTDFEVGHEYQFALEFRPYEMIPTDRPGKSLVWVHASDYEFVGEVLFSEPTVTLLDVGVLCCQVHGGATPHDAPPARSFVRGRLDLGVDPFDWFGGHDSRGEVPEMVYRWRVREVLLETTPWVETRGNGWPVFQRREGRRSFCPVQKTDAWHDDNGRAAYVLNCALLGSEPQGVR